MIEIIEICTLSEKHFRLLDDFSCVESDEELIGYKSKEKQINVAALKGLEVREISGLVFMNLDCYKHKKSYYESFGFVLNKSQLYDEEHYGPLSMRIGLDEFLETIPQ